MVRRLHWYILVLVGITFCLAACAAEPPAIPQAVAAPPTGGDSLAPVEVVEADTAETQTAPDFSAPQELPPMEAPLPQPPQNLQAEPAEGAAAAGSAAAAAVMPVDKLPRPPLSEDILLSTPGALQAQKRQPVELANLPFGPQIGQRAPEFVLPRLDGTTVSLADYLGQPILINYWSTWCIPCKDELPILEKLYQEYAPRGLVILGINAIEKDELEKVKQSVQAFGMSFPVLLDQGDVVYDAYEARFFPTSILIDVRGVIRHIQRGSAPEAKLRTQIEEILK